jgi:hypothetical protein
LATPVFCSTLTRPLVNLMFSLIPSKHPNIQTTKQPKRFTLTVHNIFLYVSLHSSNAPVLNFTSDCMQPVANKHLFLTLRFCRFLLSAILL